MFSWLKKHFIPHEGNDHRPHILRGSSVRNIIVIVIFLELFTFLIPTLTHLNTTGNMAAVLPAVLADLTNTERQSQNLPTLTESPILNKAAKMKAEDMAVKGYFAHTSPEGKTPWYWLTQAGYQYQYAGENLAINFSDSKDVTDAWMASSAHKANIVKGNYTEIGTGVASGMYEGKKTIFVAQVYANPFPKTAEKIQPKTITKTIPARPPAQTGASGEVAPKVTAIKEPTNVLGIEVVSGAIEPIQSPALWQKLLASPRNNTNTILYIVFGIIFIALFLYVSQRASLTSLSKMPFDLITNGLIVMAVVGAVFIANHYLIGKNMVIAQSIEYSNEN